MNNKTGFHEIPCPECHGMNDDDQYCCTTCWSQGGNGVIKIPNLSVGSKVVLLREMLGEKVGSIGYVYEVYPHPEDSDRVGVSVIFSCGGYDGFSPMEQDLFLKYVDDAPCYSDYVFKNVMQVSIDFQHGYWRFE